MRNVNHARSEAAGNRVSATQIVERLIGQAAPRQGFVKADFEEIVGHLPDHLQDFARFGYVTGTRRGEIAKLAWADVDREGQKITFRREYAKNGQPRVIPFVGALVEIMARRWTAREYKAPGGPGLTELVFHHRGKPIVDFRKRWAKACEAAKMPGLIFHDLRRSAVRNLISAGVDQTVAMKITGHRTVSVFQRYRIVSDDDVRAALERTEAASRLAPARNLVTLRTPTEAGS